MSALLLDYLPLAIFIAVALAIVLLHEPLHALQFGGLVIAVAGAVIITVTRPRDFGGWRSWALLLPLGGALLRGVVPPIVKLGLEIDPDASPEAVKTREAWMG
jgi:drug/metabolite transporter (DMT)-like permease